MQLTDPEKVKQLRSRFIKHEDHYDISRWHLALHPSVAKECARNSLGPFFYPTRVKFSGDDGKTQTWSSRRHRKNIYKRPVIKLHSLWHGLANMRRIEYYNVSWWVAVCFTLGSVVWVINGFAGFLPFCNSHFTKAQHSQGWTAFIGATIFELGSIFGILEAWNRDDAASFGWNVEKAINPKSKSTDEENQETEEPSPSESGSDSNQGNGKPKEKWIWFSADGKYFREMGFLGAFFQLLAASIFWISGFTAIPSIQSKLMENTGLDDGIFWTPQVIGGTGFMISAQVSKTFIMLEAQTVWWKPRIWSFEWQVGVWNFIGAVGFLLSGAFGYAATTSSGAEYQSALSTFWGGWAFLIGSVIQWLHDNAQYQTLNVPLTGFHF